MSETVQSFERGLAVIRAFDAQHPEMTLAEASRVTGLSRAAVRRLLMTLEGAGYARRNGDRYSLTPRVLELGYAYLSAFGLSELAVPYLEELSAAVNESSSVAVLDGTDIVYVARVPAKRIMTVSIGLGSRFPAYRTSMGRVLLAALEDDEVADVWERSDRSYPTPHTVQTLDALLEALQDIRAQGWAMVDQELELGVRSVAAPIHDGGADDTPCAALNVSTHVSRTTKAQLLSTFIPALKKAADAIDAALHRRPGLARNQRNGVR
jgi:IclR family transcriptional regulator, pca regulon regulatory protein